MASQKSLHDMDYDEIKVYLKDKTALYESGKITLQDLQKISKEAAVIINKMHKDIDENKCK